MFTQFEKKSLFNSSLKLFARRVLAAYATPLYSETVGDGRSDDGQKRLFLKQKVSI